MPIGVSAYVPLANVTLSASAASVTFSSISQAYQDLVLVSYIPNASASAEAFLMRVNGNTANYNTVRAYGTGSNWGSSVADLASAITLVGAYGLSSSNPTMARIDLLDYAATNKHKVFSIRGDMPNDSNANIPITQVMSGRWASTAAITSINLLTTNSVSFGIGSTFALYGVSS